MSWQVIIRIQNLPHFKSRFYLSRLHARRIIYPHITNATLLWTRLGCDTLPLRPTFEFATFF